MEYVTNNIIVGKGEVPAVIGKHGNEWVLPGGKRTRNKALALQVARRLDQLITANQSKYNRTLFK